MAYFIFLKYLDSLEEFRKNPHVKIPPKSSPTNFQSLGIFKNQIVIQKKNSSLSAQSAQQPAGPSGLSASHGPFFSFQPPVPPPLSPLGLGPLAGPAHPLGPADRTLVAPCPIAASLTGKCLTSRRFHPSPCLADRWAPPIITFLRRLPSSTPRRRLVEPPWLPRPPLCSLALWPTVTTP
jgi:hypothetical protein